MMTRLLLVFFCLFGLTLAELSSPANAQKMDKKIPETPLPKVLFPKSNAVTALPVPVTVKTVIDPLTFTDTEGTVYRLTGLDSPALSDTGEKDKPLYKDMKAALEKLVTGQNLILYVPLSPQGEAETLINRMGHKRVYAVREKDKIWLQGALLRQGMARVRTTKDEAALSSELLKEEDKARKAKVGLWKESNYGVYASEAVPANFYGFGIVEGTIRSVSAVRNTIYLNFGTDWKTDFSLGLSPEMRRNFAKDGVNVMNWGGQKVRVRGNIRQYNGPFIDLDHSAQVEHLEDNAAQEAASPADQTTDQAVPDEEQRGDNARAPAPEKRDNYIPFNL